MIKLISKKNNEFDLGLLIEVKVNYKSWTNLSEIKDFYSHRVDFRVKRSPYDKKWEVINSDIVIENKNSLSKYIEWLSIGINPWDIYSVATNRFFEIDTSLYNHIIGNTREQMDRIEYYKDEIIKDFEGIDMC